MTAEEAVSLGRRIEVYGTVQAVGFRPWIDRLAHEEGVGADLATCPECEREIFDPRDRRYRYPFTSCTNCGPRFTIAQSLPFDRATTTMAELEMCPRCRAEYERVEDRRFHAQPNACPVCGPKLQVVSSEGGCYEGRDPLSVAALALKAGLVVAVQGLGGFHLACDATAGEAVERLRQRKRRDARPFAVMVRDLAAAERIAVIGEEERALLTSVERPIVLLRRRPDSGVCHEVAPDLPLIGLMLPDSPLHHLLLAEAGRPLVMISGHLSEEPIVRDPLEALEKLGGIADLFLVHDREIANRCDDSVARVIAGAPVVLRRSRGYVPRPIAMARPFARPVLACGAHLENAVCLGAGDAAWLGPHVGDLETMETWLSYQESIERLETLVGIDPEGPAVIAHDLHPDDLSTRYAIERAERTPGALRIGVQHHHAHIASAMAEHGLEGPVLGLAFDGTGFGTDGTAWGGEFLIADLAGFERVGTFRAMPLAGGDLAIREVWRLALAVLDDAFAGEPPLAALPAFQAFGIDEHAVDVVRQRMATGRNTPRARGVGRWFDAIGALVLGRPVSRYEGEVAALFSLAADPAERSQYEFDLDLFPIVEIDPRPMVRSVVNDLLAGRSPAVISAKFQNTLATMAGDVVCALQAARGELPVVLTGDCFQNALLAERIVANLAGGPRIWLHREVPPGDGGLALGQAVVADAIARKTLEQGGA